VDVDTYADMDTHTDMDKGKDMDKDTDKDKNNDGKDQAHVHVHVQGWWTLTGHGH
jgi:hypothetical protein